MQKILEGSIVYRFIAAVYLWFGAQWQKSRVIAYFLSPGVGERASEISFFTRAWLGLHRVLCAVFEKLMLNKLLRGSIFTMPYIWVIATFALAPILPTMVILGLTLMCFISLILTFCCNRERTLVYSSINKYVLLFAFTYIVATLTSVTVSGSLLGGALTTLFVIFTIVTQNSVTTRRQLDTLVYALVISGTVVSLYGFYQYLFITSGSTRWVDSEMFSDISGRVYSTLDNPNVLAEYLLLVIPFAGASVMIKKGALPKLFFSACLAVMLVCMLLTYSRGGWLGLVAAAAVFFVMLDRRFILAGVATLILLYFALPEHILSRFLSIGDVTDSSTAYRVSIYLATIALLRDFWFTGIGPGVEAFNRIYPLYSFNAVHAPHSHNLYLQITVEAGIIGIIAFLLIAFSYFRFLCSAISREKDKTSKILQIAAISSVFGFLVQSLTDHSFYNYRVTLVFWAVLGLGMLIARRGKLMHHIREEAPQIDQGS
jgi:O-antigen ligase